MANEHTVTALLEHGLRQDPDAVAVTDAAGTLTHAELDEASAAVAAYLRHRGVGPGSRVGLCLDRSRTLVVAVLGVLRSGAAYVPLDPTYPVDRLRLMLDDAHAARVITERSVLQRSDLFDDTAALSAATDVWEALDLPGDVDPADDAADHSSDVDPADDAYVIFTSGSTGRPKGVQMPHRALANLVRWQLDRDTFAHGARVLQYSSISFDVSFQEIATTIASAGHLVMIDDDARRDPRRLLAALRDHHVQRLFLPFVALRSLVDAATANARRDRDGRASPAAAPVLPPDLREVITAGEQLRVDDALREAFAHGCRLDNQYGPSETHVITAYQLPADSADWPELPPIGTPVDGCFVALLDEERQPVPTDVIGEIHLGGVHLAHGYVDQPERTAEAFIAVDFEQVGDPTPVRLYRTGDLGRIDPHGLLHYVGRADHQVKIRGHRVEPGEISAVAARLPEVTQALTHTFRTPRGAPYLVTYLTGAGLTGAGLTGAGLTGAGLGGAGEEPMGDDAAPTRPIDVDAVRHHLRQHLPAHMVPAFIVQLDTIALGASGKADVASLPDPRITLADGASAFATSSDVPPSDTEARLAAIWRDVLEFPVLPPGADFFELGGDSLAAVSLFLRITDEFGVDLPLATVTSHPTVAALAAAIDEATADSARSAASHRRALQVLHEGDPSVPPLFLVHGGAGNVLVFAELARNLPPDQTVCAFQWQGWDGGPAPRTIPAMARAYRDELLDFAPSGPYRLGGHCIGGLIALELAALLRADGARIDGPLIISDTPYPAASTRHHTVPWWRRPRSDGSILVGDHAGDRHGADDEQNAEGTAFAAARESVLSQVPPELRVPGWRGPSPEPDTRTAAELAQLDPIRRALHRVPRLRAALVDGRRRLQTAQIRLRVQAGRRIPHEQRLLYCTSTMLRAVRHHRPTPSPERVVYFRTGTFHGELIGLPGWWEDPLMGFGELIVGADDGERIFGRSDSGPIELHVVGGDHDAPLDLDYTAAVIARAFG